MSKILGVDPGLTYTGWGIVLYEKSCLSYVASGRIHTSAVKSLAQRLGVIADALTAIVLDYRPCGGAVEDIYVNGNPQSSLKLAHARGVALMILGKQGLKVGEYKPNQIKKALVGQGHSSKSQMQGMISRLLGGGVVSSDEADALAVAITHAHCGEFYDMVVRESSKG